MLLLYVTNFIHLILTKYEIRFSFRLYMALAQATYVRSGNQILSCKSHKACPEGFACCNLEGGNEWVFCTLDQVTCIEKWNFFLECRRSMSLVKSVLCSMLWVFIIFFMSQGNVCMPGCMENAVAKQLLRLILTGTVVNIACDFFYGLVYKKLFHVSS